MKRRIPKGFKTEGLRGLVELVAQPERPSILDFAGMEWELNGRFLFRLDEESYEYLDEVSALEGISMAAVVRLALDEFIERHPIR